MLYFFP